MIVTLLNRKTLDEWFPTVVRYLGVLLVFVLAVSTIINHGHVEYPSLIIAATGMILYKTIRGSNESDDELEERWSHLE